MISNCYPFMIDDLGNMFKMETYLERIDLDKECKEDIRNGNGFIISQHQDIKKDLKEPNGIFSTKFGSTLSDANPYAEKTKCQCGYMMGAIHEGMTCPICGTEVTFIDDNFNLFGWTILKDEYCIIHPNLYKELEVIINSQKLQNIIKPIMNRDSDGFTIEEKENKDEPYKGKGILWFRDHFNEVLEYYYNSSPNKKSKYDTYIDLLQNQDKIFTHSIPIFTALLRPFKLDGNNFAFNDVNGMYNMIVKFVHDINIDGLKIHRKRKPKLQLLYDLQMKLNKLYAEIENIISGKKGIMRQLFGGRCNFTARDVIIPDDELRVDQVKLSYYALVGLLEQKIINILVKTYNIGYNEAHDIWYQSSIQKDQRVYNIIKSLIDSKNGVQVLINRPEHMKLLWVLPIEIYGVKPF